MTGEPEALRAFGESAKLVPGQSGGACDMIVTFLLGAIAGFVAGPAEERIKPFVTQYFAGPAPKPAEMRAISLAACLFLAALVAYMADGGSALALTLGGVIGVLGPRLQAKFKSARAPDYDS